MSNKLDMSLGDIIKASKSGRRGGGRGGRRGGGRGGSRGSFAGSRAGFGNLRSTQKKTISRQSNNTQRNMSGKWQHDMFDGSANTKRTAGLTTANALSGKLLVSNLHFGVSNADIKELFAEFGPLKKAAVHYDKSGRSLGTADVVFERKVDGIKAMKRYDGIPLDGREMNIQLATSLPEAINSKPFTGGAQKRLGTRLNRGGGGNSSGGFKRGRGGRRGGRSRGPAPTAEELDADLDAFVSKMDID